MLAKTGTKQQVDRVKVTKEISKLLAQKEKDLTFKWQLNQMYSVGVRALIPKDRVDKISNSICPLWSKLV